MYKIIKGEVRKGEGRGNLFVFVVVVVVVVVVFLFVFVVVVVVVVFVYFFGLFWLQQVLEPSYQPHFMKYKLDKTAGMLHKNNITF